jgi:hypothetical protein
MKRLYLLIFAVMSALMCLTASAMPKDEDYIPTKDEQAKYHESIYRSYNFVVIDGDTLVCFNLRPITIFPKLKFKNKKEEQFYWRTVRNVRILLPYAKLIRETLVETYEYIETFPTQKEREAYLKRMEKDVFKQYKPILKKFSRSQARLLIKLVQRETDQSSYEIVKAFLGSFRASFWQGFGKLFGVSLKGDFNPSKNREDYLINRIATQVEQGTL